MTSITTFLNVDSSCPSAESENYFDHLVELYELDSCIEWIQRHKFEKVCLQFPESLLVDSVDVACYIEHRLLMKVFIIGDTAYGSCCVDEVAASHVNGDALIHFGHSCLSPVSIPVYYVFLKKKLDIPKFLDLVEKKIETPGPILMVYDVGYAHILKQLRKEVMERPMLQKCVVIPELVLPHQEVENVACSKWCFIKNEKYKQHFNMSMQRAYCAHPETDFQALIYIGAQSPTLYNFSYFFKEGKVYFYSNSMEDLEEYCKACVAKQLSYSVERIREARSVGVIVATLGIRGYKEAMDYAKTLCKISGKKCYILSIGKTTPTKLANFSEIDIFVAISCPESDFGDKKAYMQPIVGLYELDLALNKGRSWSTGHTRDFREVLKGSADFIEPKDNNDGSDSYISETYSYPLVPKKVQDNLLAPTSENSIHQGWKGLQQNIGEDKPAKLKEGRKGGPQKSYDSEPKEDS